MGSHMYVLDADGNPVPEPSVAAWGEWYGTTDCSVARTDIGESTISTVFLGTDHRFGGNGAAPILWESLVFEGPLKDEMNRYTSREAALAGHEAIVDRVKHATFGQEWYDAYVAEKKARRS